MKKIGLYLGFIALALLASCSEDAEDTQTIEGEFTQTEVQTILVADETTSAVDNILSELYLDNGGTNKAASNDCYSVEYLENGFIATFNNCVLNETENVNGTLNVMYSIDESSATYTATFEDFYVGTTRVNGTRTYTITGSEMENTVGFSITSNISLEFENGDTLSESGTKTFAILFEEGQDTLWNLSGNWTVVSNNDTYTISGNVSKDFLCEYWTQGSMNISKNGLAVDVDFGDGTCDDQAVITYPNGATQNITLD